MILKNFIHLNIKSPIDILAHCIMLSAEITHNPVRSGPGAAQFVGAANFSECQNFTSEELSWYFL